MIVVYSSGPVPWKDMLYVATSPIRAVMLISLMMTLPLYWWPVVPRSRKETRNGVPSLKADSNLLASEESRFSLVPVHVQRAGTYSSHIPLEGEDIFITLRLSFMAQLLE